MKSKKRTIWILIVVIVVLLGFASSLLIYRNKLSSDNVNNKSGDNIAQSLSSAPSGKSIENFYDKPITDEKIALDSIEVNRNKLGYSDKSFTFRYDKTSSSETAYHFDLYYNDIPVFDKGVGVFTHYDNNNAKILMTSVSDSEKIIKVNTTPKITEDEAIDIAKENLGKDFCEYKVEFDSKEVGFKQVRISPKLIIYKTDDQYILSYYINFGSYMCVINAESGDIITAHSTLVSKSAEYEGQRKGDIQQIFYDDVPLDNSSKKKNALYCKEKNIFVYDDLKEGKFDFEKLLTLNDIDSGKNKSAVDAMANTYKAIKYFEKFGIFLDAVHIQVNDTDELESQFLKKTLANSRIEQHDDESITLAILNFGTKDISGRQYSAYLDIVAHEYTHCITNLKAFGSEGYKKDRRYFERNALMEAYSDVFGELIEQKYTGDTDWKVGDGSLIEPTFGSEYKYKYSKKRKTKDDEGTKENDYGYAHDNSTIISHTAYLMSKSNDSKKYDAEFLLDYNQLAQLWYGSLGYLKKTDFMDFADCRWAIEESARDLIEKGVLLENNLKIIEQAFNEVEVISNPTRRGLTDSMEIIEEENTIVVPIEDETPSTEYVEITETPTEPQTTEDEIITSEPIEISGLDSVQDTNATESINEKAYIDLHSYYVNHDVYSDNHGRLDVNAYTKKLNTIDVDMNKYNDTYAVATFLTQPRTIYINNDNNRFMQFDFDSHIVYYDGEYSISEENYLKFNYKSAYLYTDSFDDIYYHPENVYMNQVSIQDANYEYDYWNGELEKELHDVSNAKECGFMVHVGVGESWYFDDLPTPYFLTNINGENKWTDAYHANDACQVYIEDDYIITNQKGWFFSDITGTDDFVLEYSNSELIDEPENLHVGLSYSQELEDLRINDFKVKFNADKTWNVISSTGYDYNGEKSGTWELIDEHILAIIGEENDKVIGNMNFLYLNFDKNEIELPLFVECDDMLKYIHMLKT